METETPESLKVHSAVTSSSSNENSDPCSMPAGTGAEEQSSPQRCSAASKCRGSSKESSCSSADVQDHVVKLCAKTNAMLSAHQERLQQCLNEWSVRHEQALKAQQASLEKSLRFWSLPPRMTSPSKSFFSDKAAARSRTFERRKEASMGPSRSEPDAVAMHGHRWSDGNLEVDTKRVNPLRKLRSSLHSSFQRSIGIAPKESLTVPCTKPLEQMRYGANGKTSATSGKSLDVRSDGRSSRTSKASKASKVSFKSSVSNEFQPESSGGSANPQISHPNWCNSPSAQEGSMRELRRGYSLISRETSHKRGKERHSVGIRRITDIIWDMELVPEMESPQKRKRTGRFPRIRKMVKNPLFDILCGMVVIANAAIIGVEADNLMKGSTDRFHVTQLCFNGWYVLELLLRVAAEYLDFFTSKDGVWNLFDVVLLVTVLLEVFSVGSTGTSAVMGRFVRSLRVLRVVRTLRIVRVLRYIREFRKMIFAIAASMKTLFWSLLLLSIIMYMYGVCLTQGVAEWLHERGELQDGSDDAEELRRVYGSVGLSMYSLYMSISNGLSWGVVAEPLLRVHWSLLLFFVTFISICFFGVLNVVTSVFVESAMQVATHYRELLVQEKMHEKEVYAIHMREVFKQIDVDESGEISMEEMEHFLADEHLRAYLEALEIGLVESRNLFKLLDHDDSGWVDIDEFCEGCLRLKGEAKSFDIHCLRYEFHKIMVKWWQFMRYVEVRFEDLEEHMKAGKANVEVGNDDVEGAGGGADSGQQQEASTSTSGLFTPALGIVQTISIGSPPPSNRPSNIYSSEVSKDSRASSIMPHGQPPHKKTSKVMADIKEDFVPSRDLW